MKNNEEKFFLYLKDRMSSQERIIFEDELKNSEVLHKDFEEYKNIAHLVIETKNIKINNDYSESIVPDFRRRLERMNEKKSFKKLKYVFASLLIIVTGYFVLSYYNGEKKQELYQAIKDLSNDEIDSIANDFYVSEDFTQNIDDVSSQKIYSIYAEDLNSSLVESVGELNANTVLIKYHINDVDQYLSDTDIELIYLQLSEKKIL